MKPSKLYSLPPIKSTHDFNIALSALEFFDNDFFSYDLFNNKMDDIERDKKIQTNYYLDESDYYYTHELFTILYENKPFMVVKRSGKHGDDYDCYLTDETLFKELKSYLIQYKNILPPSYHVFSPDDSIEYLENVGHCDFKLYYSSKLEPKYQVGDIVWGFSSIDPHKRVTESNYFMLSRLQIKKINPFNPMRQYEVVPLDKLQYIDYKMKPQFFYEVCEKEKEKELTNKDKTGRYTVSDTNDALILNKVSNIPIPSLAINHFINSEKQLDNYPGFDLEQIDTILKAYKLEEKLPTKNNIVKKVKI